MTDKKKIPGVVDRIEGDIIVIVAQDPKDGINKEIYVDKKQLKKIVLKEGDPVTVEMSQMMAKKRSHVVTLEFCGTKTKEAAKTFFTYLVDGGLEDIVAEAMSKHGISIEISEFDDKTLSIRFKTSTKK